MSGTKILDLTLKRHLDVGQAIAWAAQQRGISRLRLAADMIRRRMAWQRVSPEEYFYFSMHEGWMTPARKAAFLGEARIATLNDALTWPPDAGLRAMINDKPAAERHLRAAGLPVPQSLATFRAGGGDGADLADAAAMAAFLTTAADLPLFGKPTDGSRSLGTLSVIAREGAGEVRLGNGRVVPALALAQEIAAEFPGGYLWQRLMRPHPDLAALTGPTLPALRLLTLFEGSGPALLYACTRIPSQGAMADDVGAGLPGTVLLDPGTGRIERVQDPRRIGRVDVELSPYTGNRLPGAVLPDYARAVDLALRAQAMFPRQRILGVDMALTEDGPVVMELNTNPFHTMYQRVAGCGILRPEFLPRLVAMVPAGHPIRRRLK